MTVIFANLAHSSIQQLKPYQPGKPINELQRKLDLTDIIKLASNESPLAPNPLAIAATIEVLETIEIYPGQRL